MRRSGFLTASASALLLPGAARSAAAAAEPGSAPPRSSEREISNAFSLPLHQPLELKMDALDGPQFRLSAFRGAVVFLNIFATWCPPCRDEQPDLVDFADTYRGDTAVIGLNAHELDDKVRLYRKQFGVFYPIAMDRFDSHIPGIYKRADAIGYPATIVIKPDGTLGYAWVGGTSRKRFESERLIALGTTRPSATGTAGNENHTES